MISLWSSSKVTKSQINVSLSDTKDSEKYWVKAIKFKNNSIAKSALAEFVFRISTPGVDVERTNQVQTRSNDVYNNRRND